MITIVPVSTPDKKLLNKEEIEAAVAIIEVINRWFQNIGLGIGSADLQVIKWPSLGYPLFSPHSLNPGFPCDQIYISMDQYTRWDQFIFQASHEFTHCVIHRLNTREEQKVSWIEETICEAISLVFLNTFANNWSKCTLSKNDPSYRAFIQDYLGKQLKNHGNHRLENCHGIEELHEINRTSEDQREDRREERNRLFRLIRSSMDIQALAHYRDFVVPGTILLDIQRYQGEYLSSRPVQYLCSLQENALRRDAVTAKVSEEETDGI